MMVVVMILAAVAAPAPLTEADVLAAVDARVPVVAMAEARADLAAARRLDARAGADPQWTGTVSRKEGYYASTRADFGLTVDTTLGATVRGGYRLGVGDFAEWDGKAQTLDGGEVGVDLAVAVRDLGLPEVRADVAGADAAVAAALSDVDDVMRATRLEATRAYWSWVRAGRILMLEEALLERAIRRDAALAAEVEAGNRAAIDLVDNARVLAERRGRVARAEAALVEAAQTLGLWLRDADGTPSPPTRARLPLRGETPSAVDESVDDGIERALARRPELHALDAELRGADVAVRRASRELLPELGIIGSVSQDVGDGPASKAPLEVRVGASIGGSLLWRQGRAASASARARRAALVAQRRQVADAIVAEVRSVHAGWVAAARAWEAAAESARLAEDLLVLERRRQELGGSDVFRLVLREEAFLDASAEVVNAEAAYFSARAAWRAATNDSEIPK